MCFIELASPSSLTIRQLLLHISDESDKAATGPWKVGEFVIGHLSFFICHFREGEKTPSSK
jgi:hypothetical protein